MNFNRPAPVNARAFYQQKYNISRGNLLLVVAMTIVNVVMAALGSDSYFLFSAILPYSLALNGAFLTGKMPDDWYGPEMWPEGKAFLPDSFFYVMITIAAVILVLYLACWFFSKKNKTGWLIAALVLFGIDTIYMLFIYGIGTNSILDIVFHALVVYYLISGIVYSFKLKKLPPEDEVIDGIVTDIPVAGDVPTPQEPVAGEASAPEAAAPETPAAEEATEADSAQPESGDKTEN